jgi:hypothetical protein
MKAMGKPLAFDFLYELLYELTLFCAKSFGLI